MKLPIFKAQIDLNDYETGVFRISLVEKPATETDFQLFSKNDKPLNFSIENDEKHLAKGVIMLADTPIYRRSPEGYEYYIEFDKETLRQMAQKMLRFGYQNNLNTDHNGDTFVEGVYMQEIFVKDTEKGINPKGFEDTPDGSLFATYKVNDFEIWEKMKNGEWTGFSLEGQFNLEEVEPEDTELDEVLSLIEQLKNKMK